MNKSDQKELKEDVETIKEKVRKPLTHREKLECLRELTDHYIKNLKEPMTADDLFNWVKFGFVAGA